MRLFLGIKSDEELIRDSTVINTTVDARSCISSCNIGSNVQPDGAASAPR